MSRILKLYHYIQTEPEALYSLAYICVWAKHMEIQAWAFHTWDLQSFGVLCSTEGWFHMKLPFHTAKNLKRETKLPFHAAQNPKRAQISFTLQCKL